MSTRRRSARAGVFRVLLDCLVRDWAPRRRGRRARRGRGRTRRRRTRRRRTRRRDLRARRPRTDGTAAPFARGNPRPVARAPSRARAPPFAHPLAGLAPSRPRPSRRRAAGPFAHAPAARRDVRAPPRANPTRGGRERRARHGGRCAWQWRHRRRFRGVGALGATPRSPFASRRRSPSRALFGALFALSGVGRSLGRCAEVVSARDGWRASDWRVRFFQLGFPRDGLGRTAPVKSNRLITPHLARGTARSHQGKRGAATPRTWTLEANSAAASHPRAGEQRSTRSRIWRQTPLAQRRRSGAASFSASSSVRPAPSPADAVR